MGHYFCPRVGQSCYKGAMAVVFVSRFFSGSQDSSIRAFPRTALYVRFWDSSVCVPRTALCVALLGQFCACVSRTVLCVRF